MAGYVLQDGLQNLLLLLDGVRLWNGLPDRLLDGLVGSNIGPSAGPSCLLV